MLDKGLLFVYLSTSVDRTLNGVARPLQFSTLSDHRSNFPLIFNESSPVKLPRQTITIDCPSEVAFLNAVGEVEVLMEENGIEEKLISQRNLNVCELIDKLETA